MKRLDDLNVEQVIGRCTQQPIHRSHRVTHRRPPKAKRGRGRYSRMTRAIPREIIPRTPTAVW